MALATVMVGLAVTQLYKFEDFPDVIAALGLLGSETWAPTIAALLVVGEVLALPFLLRMTLSPAMRIVSMVSGWSVIAAWLVISIWTNVSVGQVPNSGILGATVPIPSGWGITCIFAGLGLLAAWSAWGLWPCRTSVNKR